LAAGAAVTGAFATGALATGAFAGAAFTGVFAAGFAAGLVAALAAGFTGVFAVFLVGIVLLLFFEDRADARTSVFDAPRLVAGAFLVPFSLEPLSFILEVFL
jgi:hypothetical protein